MGIVTSKSNVIVEFNGDTPTIVSENSNTSKHAVLVEIDSNIKHLTVVDQLLDNGEGLARTMLKHYYHDGFVWERKTFSRLQKENQIVKRFEESQSFNVHTSREFWVHLLGGLNFELEFDIANAYNYEEILDENGDSYDPIRLNYTTLKPGYLPAYDFFESIIRPMQLNDISSRYPAIGEEFNV